MCSLGGIGGILGGIAGTGLSILQPELLPFTLPLIAGAGGGSFLGTSIGDLISGKPVGESLKEGAISGGISGALAGAGNVAAGGDFFGAPASSITGVFSGAPTAAADTLAGSTTAATTGAAVPASLASAAPAAATTVAPTVGVGGGGPTLGGDISSGIGGAVGSTPANVSGAVGAGGVPTGTQLASLGGVSDYGGGADVLGPAGAVGPSGPQGATSLLPTDYGGGADSPGSSFAAPAASPGMPTGYSGLTPAQTDAVNTKGFFMNPDAVTPYVAGTRGAPSLPSTGDGSLWSFLTRGGSSPLSKGLVGEPGSILGDLTKPSTLITAGAAGLPLLMNNTIPGLSGIQNQARTYNAMGTPLAQSLQTGNLPAGAQSSLDAQTRAATAAVRSRFAQMGLSGSSQEADALGMVQANEASQKVKMLGDITTIGLDEMAKADPLLGTIMQQRLAADLRTQQNLQRLVAALAGSTGQEKTTA